MSLKEILQLLHSEFDELNWEKCSMFAWVLSLFTHEVLFEGHQRSVPCKHQNEISFLDSVSQILAELVLKEKIKWIESSRSDLFSSSPENVWKLIRLNDVRLYFSLEEEVFFFCYGRTRSDNLVKLVESAKHNLMWSNWPRLNNRTEIKQIDKVKKICLWYKCEEKIQGDWDTFSLDKSK